ncbi:MAG: hypothetical protein EP344_13450 [Bacteroidetes bacterium]|nr:MAG: hypothetical protein EP344_13450 [Bacteroidota bacterium]
MGQIVDTETAMEFMKETLEKVEERHLVRISEALEVKSELFRQQFEQSNIARLTEEDLMNTLRYIFSVRRTAKKMLEKTGLEPFKQHVHDLLYGNEPIQSRFQDFCGRMEGLDEHLRFDLAGELLHFTFPDQYWLWCHWMWNPKIKTGSLPLVTTEEFDLTAPSLGEAYLKVGKAIAFVHEVGEAAGFQTISRKLFGTDVYLSCVYVIYAYTVLRMRMTQEFNQVMPGVAEFSTRILGVYGVTADNRN